jgi:hypothetical protein
MWLSYQINLDGGQEVLKMMKAQIHSFSPVQIIFWPEEGSHSKLKIESVWK